MSDYKSFKFAQAVTPHATTANVFEALYVAVAGDVAVQTAAGDDVIITCATGAFLPIAVTLVYAAGTDATGITGFRNNV